jgi:hypothetical protein
MNISSSACLGLILILVAIQPGMADSFTGSFSGKMEGEQYQLTIRSETTGQYAGELRVAGEAVPLNARRFGDRIAGQIGNAADGFGFVAQIQGNGLLLQDEDGEIIVFKRDSAIAGPAPEPGEMRSSERQVYINRVRLDPGHLEALESRGQVPIADGRYWYDTYTGAWGVEGGPTAGLIYPELTLPSPMPADISGGGTGIFINGREIHALDQQALYQLFGVTYQGNFWMDAEGNIGYVGGPAIANVLQASQASQSAQSGGSDGSVTHGYDSTYGARGTAGGGMYSGRSATGKSVFWYPGM